MAEHKQPKVRKGHCPECGPERHADVISEHKKAWDDEHEGIWHSKEWCILQCRGCESVYMQTLEFFSEDTVEYKDENGEWHQRLNEKFSYWPAPLKREEPEWS